jgi:hypothetical protein
MDEQTHKVTDLTVSVSSVLVFHQCAFTCPSPCAVVQKWVILGYAKLGYIVSAHRTTLYQCVYENGPCNFENVWRF